jgi:ribosomal protein L37AE/L43A
MANRLINQWRRTGPNSQVFIDETGAEIGRITAVFQEGVRRFKWEAQGKSGYGFGIMEAKEAATDAIRRNKALLNGWQHMSIDFKREYLIEVLEGSNAKLESLGTEQLELISMQVGRGMGYRIGQKGKPGTLSKTLRIEDAIGYLFGYVDAAKRLLEVPKCSLCNQNKGVYRNIKAGWWICEECSPHFAKHQDDYDSGKVSLNDIRVVVKRFNEAVSWDQNSTTL